MMLRDCYFLIILNATCLFSFGQAKRIYLRDVGKGDDRNVVYIENNHHNKYYSFISDFRLDKYDIIDYRSELKRLKKKKQTFKKWDLLGLSNKWCSLRYYKGKYYVYSPSDYCDNYHIQLNDTIIVEKGCEIALSVILEVKKTNEITYSIKRKDYSGRKNNIIIHLIDPLKGIAVFENLFPITKDKFWLMVQAEKIRQFPIIINDCTSSRVGEWDFDKPDFKKLLAR